MKLRIAQLGLGPIGVETIRLAAVKPWIEVVGAIDCDPRKVGADLGEVTGVTRLSGCRVVPNFTELPKSSRPEIVIQTSVSNLEAALLQIEPIVRDGCSVVSSCEELVFPNLRQPGLAAQIDALCKANQTRVVGTGVNPGFVMDLLPLCLTAVCRDVQSIRIERVVNASTRREPLQRKIGSSCAPREFQVKLDRGEAGHAGLRESLALLAHGLGWNLEEVTERKSVVVADRPIRTAHFEVAPGQVCGIHQSLEGKVQGKTRLVLDLTMRLDAPDPCDRVQVEGRPPLDVTVAGGVAGDDATPAALINLLPRLTQAPAGLLLPIDLPLPRFA